MIRFDRHRALGYLDRCRTPENGYCHFLDRESGVGFPNVADTYWALASYRFLESEPPHRSATLRWLRNGYEQNKTLHSSPYLSWALASLCLAGDSLSETDRNLLVKETENLLNERVPNSEIPSLLGDLGAILSVRLRLGHPLTELEKNLLERLLDQEESIPGALPLPELQNRRFLETLVKGPSTRPEGPGDLPYRHRVFGYTLVPGTSRSDLFVLRSGFLMRQDPLSRSEFEKLNSLIVLCQSREGGFGQLGGAIPTLEATCAALYLLLVLLPRFFSPSGREGICLPPVMGEIGAW